MTSSYPFDLLDYWRQALTNFEKGGNSALSEQLKNPEIARSLQQAANSNLALQQAFEKMVEDHLRRLNLPSRSQVQELAEALQRVEDKLDQLLPDSSARPRPARTRQPPAPNPAEKKVARKSAAQTSRKRGSTKGAAGGRASSARKG